MDVNVNLAAAFGRLNTDSRTPRVRLMTQTFRQYLEKQTVNFGGATRKCTSAHGKTVTFSDDYEVVDEAEQAQEQEHEQEYEQRLCTIPEAAETGVWPLVHGGASYASCGMLDEEQLAVVRRGYEPPPAEWRASRIRQLPDETAEDYEHGISLRAFLGSRETALLNDARLHDCVTAKPDGSPKDVRKRSCACGVETLFHSRASCDTPTPQQCSRRSTVSCLPTRPADYSALERLAQQQTQAWRNRLPNVAYLDVEAGPVNLHPLLVSVQSEALRRLESISEPGASSAPPHRAPSTSTSTLLSEAASATAAITWRNADQSNSVQAQEVCRKREYRVGLNLFNRKPQKGLRFLMERHFVEPSPNGVAQFLLRRKGLSKRMIGQFLGDLQNQFAMCTLRAFTTMIDFSHLSIDAALRKFLLHFRLPGEAQQIEQILDVFAKQYSVCNADVVFELFNSSDTLFLLSYAIIMLNTDLHNPNVKHDRKMKLEDFVKNLKGIDEGCDVRQNVLAGIYNRIKAEPIKPGLDHVTQVEALEFCLVGPHPALAETHRRLVCYCQMQYLMFSSAGSSSCVSPLSNGGTKLKKDEVDLFLFNDVLLVTKRKDKRKQRATYIYLQCLKLSGMKFQLISAPFAEYGFSLFYTDEACAVFFNAKSDSDRAQFARDLHECILEVVEMEQIFKVEVRQDRHSHDSGVLDLTPSSSSSSNSSGNMCRTAMLGIVPLPHQHQHQHHNQLNVTPNSTGDACSEESLDSGIHNR